MRGSVGVSGGVPTDHYLKLSGPSSFTQSAPQKVAQKVNSYVYQGVKRAVNGSHVNHYPHFTTSVKLPNMANDASSGRFYAFTTVPSASLSPSAASPVPQYCPDTSGSDSVSDEDRGAIGHSYPVERTAQGQDIFREPFGAQDVSGFPQDRLDPASATIYLDDTSYLSTGLFRGHPASNFLQAAPNVPFAPAYGHFNPIMPPSMTSTTPHDVRHPPSYLILSVLIPLGL